MLKDVVALVLPGVASFELGVLCEVFGLDRSDEGLPNYDFAVAGLVAGEPLPMSTGGQLLTPAYGLDRVATADLVAVTPFPDGTRPPEAYLEVLRAAHGRGAWVLSLCTAAFALGHAGLLDDRDCTTHWRHAATLQERFPKARVEPNVLYVEDEGIVTSAGTAAGIDACLHLVRTEQGAAVANGIARRMVVPPHREGGQAQYINVPVAACTSDSLAPLLDWIMDHLAEDLSVECLAAHVHQSPRTFARRFRAEVGTTPHKWVTAQRVAEAERLLETATSRSSGSPSRSASAPRPCCGTTSYGSAGPARSPTAGRSTSQRDGASQQWSKRTFRASVARTPRPGSTSGPRRVLPTPSPSRVARAGAGDPLPHRAPRSAELWNLRDPRRSRSPRGEAASPAAGRYTSTDLSTQQVPAEPDS